MTKTLETLTKVTTVIDQDLCIGCGLCVEVCPSATLSVEAGKAVVTGEKSIGCGHCAAICPVGAVTVGAIDAHGYDFATFSLADKWLPPGESDIQALAALMLSRRSSRQYEDRPVGRDNLDDLIRLAISAPSGTNSQCWTFTVLDSRGQVEKFGTRVAQYFKKLNQLAKNPLARLVSRYFGGDGLGNYYRRYYKTIRDGISEWENGGHDLLFHGAPAAILVGAETGASCPMEDAMLASQNILLAAHAMGLGTCLIGFAVAAMKQEPAIKDTVGIPRDEQIYAVIALGYSKEKYQHIAGRKRPLVRFPAI